MIESVNINQKIQLKQLFGYTLAIVCSYFIRLSEHTPNRIETDLFITLNKFENKNIVSKVNEIYSEKLFKDVLLSLESTNILKNEDLNKISQKAFLTLLLDEANKNSYGFDRKIIQVVCKNIKSNWTDFINSFISKDEIEQSLTYKELGLLTPDNISEFFVSRHEKISEKKTLIAQNWKIIFTGVFEFYDYYLSQTTINGLAERFAGDYAMILELVLLEEIKNNPYMFKLIQKKLIEEIFNNTKEIKQVVESIHSKIADTANSVHELKTLTAEILRYQVKHLSKKFLPKSFPSRQKFFIGRENVLENIGSSLQRHGSVAIAETHGVGKTSVAIEFAYRNQELFSKIFFIRATINEFDFFIYEILKDLEIVLPNDATLSQNLMIFQNWLAQNQGWLLILDSIEDVSFIKSCHFNMPTGNVIYTSNNDRIYRVGTAVDLPKMTQDNAILLLYKHWQDKPQAEFADIPEKYHETLRGIAEKFGNHPFSMAFVGSYLADEDESLEEFLNAYQSKRKNLLANYAFLNNYQYPEVATAFLLRFEQISKPNETDARENFLSVAVQDYLKLSAYIGTDDIPEELLQQSLKKLHPDQTKLTDDAEFIKDIYRRFKPTSIFKRNPENKTLNTHRIVQEIMRFRINDEEDSLLSTLADSLSDNFEHFDFTNKEIVERYLTHIGIFLEYLAENKADETAQLKLENLSTARLCNRYARYFEEYGDYAKAEKYYLSFRDICEKVEEIEQTWLAVSYNNLAVLYESQGRYEEAEPYFTKALAISEKVLGENHPDTAASYNNLAGLYYSQGRYEEAEPYYLKALAISEKVLGENHPDTATRYNNLALLYKSQGRYEEAEPYLLKALAISEKVLGENHPLTATSYNNLALLYESQERYEKAEPYYLKSLRILEKVLGENHPDTASSYNNLGSFYLEQGKLTKAQELLEKALSIRMKVLGENHPYTVGTKEWLEYLAEKRRNAGE